jgi:hypothetical protein
MDFATDRAFPNVLNFSYVGFIRARGELLLKNEKSGRLPWVDVLKLDDVEFCQKCGVAPSELERLQKELPETRELDIPRSWMNRFGYNDTRGAKDF